MSYQSQFERVAAWVDSSLPEFRPELTQVSPHRQFATTSLIQYVEVSKSIALVYFVRSRPHFRANLAASIPPFRLLLPLVRQGRAGYART
jgi:hypothetical protein